MLVHSDGFDSHATGAATLQDGDALWGSQDGVVIHASAGRFGGKALHLPAGDAGHLDFSAPGATNVAFAGWFEVGALTADLPLIVDSAATLVLLKQDRSVEVRDGGGTLRTTAPAGSVPADTYTWVEVSYRSTGVYVSINGVAVGTPYVGSYTAPDEDNLALLDSPGTGIGDVFVDDFIVWDSSGDYFNTYGISPRRIQLVRPDANGASVQWTPAGASNWESVDANDWAGGTGVTSTVNGAKDRYGFANLGAVPGSIDAVTVKTRVHNDGSDPATLAHVSAQGLAEAATDPQTIPTSAPGTLRSSFYRDPAGSPWTAVTVNSAEFGQTLGI